MRQDDAEATRARSARAGENFPVASLLISRRARPLVHAFYAFARGADDVADDPLLEPDAKLARLSRYEAGLDGDPEGQRQAAELRRALASAGRGDATRHARALLGAFRQDATVSRYASWDDLMAYCRMSADPVGRFVLDIHDQAKDAYPPADALCTALQVLNHLQDLRADYERLDRVYLPLDWIAAEGAEVTDLTADALTSRLRAVVDRALAETRGLLRKAPELPPHLSSRRLAGEVRAILHLAGGLQAALEHGDPLQRRIAPGRADFLRAAAHGLAEVLRPGRRASGQSNLVRDGA